jgi:hypothetical protein
MNDPYETCDLASSRGRDSRFRVVGLKAIQKTSIVGNCGSAVRQSHR